MRLLFCYPFCTLGGCETVLSTRMRELDRLGIESSALFLRGGEGEPLFSEFHGRTTIVCDRRGIRQLLRDLAPDFLVSMDAPEIFAHAAAAPQTRLVFESHSTYPAALARLGGVPWPKLCGVLTPSHGQRELVLALFGRRICCPVEVVPNPIPGRFDADGGADVPSAPSVQPGPDCGRPIVLWVGRLDEHKNWRAFLRIAEGLCERADCEFWLVGGGGNEEKSRLWEAVKTARLVRRFRWLAHVDHQHMDRVYRFVGASGGCLVSTSRYESFGLAAAEAMAAGCPVVVPDAGGFRDFVLHDHTGLRYSAEDLSGATDGIHRLLNHEDVRQRLALAGRQWVRQELLAPVAVAKLVETLRRWQAGSPSVPACPGLRRREVLGEPARLR